MAATTSRTTTLTLPTDQEILISRQFDAPKDLVYKAWTTPELVRRWWHAKRGKVTVVDPLKIPLPARLAVVARLAPRFHERFPEAKIRSVSVEPSAEDQPDARRTADLTSDKEIVFDDLRPGRWHRAGCGPLDGWRLRGTTYSYHNASNASVRC